MQGLPQRRRAQYIAQNTLIYTCQKTYILKTETYKIDARLTATALSTLDAIHRQKHLDTYLSTETYTRAKELNKTDARTTSTAPATSGAIHDKTDLF